MSVEQQSTLYISGKKVKGGQPTNGQVLQYNSVTDLLEWTTLAGASVNELEFLAAKETAGKLHTAQGTRNGVTGVLCSYTPAVGVTGVVAKASASIWTSVASVALVQLRINGVVIEQCNILVVGNMSYTFNIPRGKQLLGDGVKTIDLNVTTLNASANAEGAISVYDL